MSTIDIKKKLNQVFDDNLHTKIWHNILDWIIIILIIASSLEVFLSTFSSISEQIGPILIFVDIFTTIFFTIEVSLRIWAADMLSPKYRGFKGRISYCLSFYGIIDILSTYPALFGLITSAPVTVLKIFRFIRLLRIFRYMKSFRILGDAVVSKKEELMISFSFLTILTVILSFLLYYAEHTVQPELCENAWQTLVWAFAKYLGDPGKIADFPMLTPIGHLIACIVGALGIAIFAVPAGLISSGFLEVIDENRAKEKLDANIERLHYSFRWEKDMTHTGLFYVPAYKPLSTLLVKQYLQESEVIDAVKASHEFHLYNLAKAYNSEDEPVDKVVVVACPHNRPYGYCIDRNSKITIVSTSSVDEPITGWVAYHIAKIGGFNYVSKDVEMDIDRPESYYTILDAHSNANMEAFLDDISKFASREGSWVIPMAFCIGPKSRTYKIHLCYNKKGNPGFDGDVCSIHDTEQFETFVSDFATIMDKDFQLPVDRNEFFGLSKQNLLHHLNICNGFALRMECYTIYFASDKIAKIKAIADIINRHFESNVEKKIPSEMSSRPSECYGYRSYIN